VIHITRWLDNINSLTLLPFLLPLTSSCHGSGCFTRRVIDARPGISPGTMAAPKLDHGIALLFLLPLTSCLPSCPLCLLAPRTISSRGFLTV
jgi:hypothetical protein